MLRFLVHYGIHLLVPLVIGFFFFKENRLKATLILLAGWLIDVDHLWADPIYDPNRCSVGFHLFHSYGAITCYLFLLFWRKTRLIGLALIIHIIADATDCLLLRF